MARINEKDLHQYSKFKIDEYPKHYLKSLFNNLLDKLPKEIEPNLEFQLSALYDGIIGVVDNEEKQEKEISKLNKYCNFLENNIKELIIK